MEKYQLEQLKKLLLQEKSNNQPKEIEMEESELSSVDNHSADSATDLMAVTTDMALEEFKEDETDKIDAALAAIEDGTYGNCKECGKEIPYERLEAIPTALTCVDHTDAENI